MPILGACKAYTSRVGDGPFPTELHDEIGSYIREAGHEYGTVTKRPRRIGWFDSVVMRHSKRVSGLTLQAPTTLLTFSGPTPEPVVTPPAIGLEDVTNGYVPWSTSNITP